MKGEQAMTLSFLKHPRVFALADMFLMPDLQAYALSNIKIQIRQHWISDTLPDCIREIYSNTYREESVLRHAVVEITRTHSDISCHKTSFQAAIREIGIFGVDNLKNLAEKPHYTDSLRT